MSQYAALDGILVRNDGKSETKSKDNEALIVSMILSNGVLEQRIIELESKITDLLALISFTNRAPSTITPIL